MPMTLVYTLITIVAVIAVIMGACAYLILVERKLAAYVQDRIGPNRVGPFGLMQPLADGLKFLFKEELIPDYVDKILFLAAPAIAMGTAMLAFAVVPFGATSPDADAYQFVIAPRVDIGILFILAIGSLNVYAIILGGWASNNKYSFIGALRSSAQVVSYEIPLGASILGVLLFTGSLNLERIIDHQAAGGLFAWNIWYQPLAFLLFLTAAFAECNRLPFDLPEAEQELVGGYHTEYSALKFGMFFLGEYTHMITTSFLLAILFFGGWHFPFIAEPGQLTLSSAIIKLLVLAVKVGFFIFVYMIVRWTIPRFRFDQLMSMAWKVLIPIALANLLCVMIVKEFRLNPWLLLPASIALFLGVGYLAVVLPEPGGRKTARNQLASAR